MTYCPTTSGTATWFAAAVTAVDVDGPASVPPAVVAPAVTGADVDVVVLVARIPATARFCALVPPDEQAATVRPDTTTSPSARRAPPDPSRPRNDVTGSGR